MLYFSMWSRFPFLSRLAIWVILPTLILAFIAYLYLLQSVPNSYDEITLEHTNSRIKISRDELWVPTVTTSAYEDTLYAVGFLHAQDRLWQMEMARKIAAGRLSEVLGYTGVQSDKLMRALGIYRSANHAWRSLNKSEKALLEAYTAGVNASINKMRMLPPEFLLAGFSPEQWQPHDSLAIAQLLGWQLSGYLEHEVGRKVLMLNMDVAAADVFLPPFISPGAIPAFQEASQGAACFVNNSTRDSINQRDSKRHILHPSISESKVLALSGEGSKSGSPVVVSDLHGGLSMPSVWYIAKTITQGKVLEGATLPGFPLILNGRNSAISWTALAMPVDTQEVVYEQINPLDGNQYRRLGDYKNMQTRHEVINIKSRAKEQFDTVELLVRETDRGPLLSDINDAIPGFTWSFDWLGNKDIASGFYRSLLSVNQAKNLEGFIRGLESYSGPSFLFVYSDRDGNIAAALPFTKSSQTKENKLLTLKNPKSGYIAAMVEYGSVGIDVGECGERRDLIQGEQGLSRIAREALVSELKRRGGNAGELAPLVERWAGTHSNEGPASILTHHWLKNITHLIVEKRLLVGRRPLVGKQPLEETLSFSSNAYIQNVLNTPNSALVNAFLDGKNEWCDSSVEDKEASCKDLVEMATERTLNYLTVKLGNDLKNWKQEKVSISHYPHFPFGSQDSISSRETSSSFLSGIFHRTVRGADVQHTNARQHLFHPINVSQYGSTYKQRVAWGTDNEFLYSQSTGQSGNPLSRHYDDYIGSHEQSFSEFTLFNNASAASIEVTSKDYE